MFQLLELIGALLNLIAGIADEKYPTWARILFLLIFLGLIAVGCWAISS